LEGGTHSSGDINRHCVYLKIEDYVGYLLSEDPAVYMNFFDWMWMWKFSKKKLLRSYEEYWRHLYQYFGLFARRPLNNYVHEQVRRVCATPSSQQDWAVAFCKTEC
jgi:hypothetical protein